MASIVDSRVGSQRGGGWYSAVAPVVGYLSELCCWLNYRQMSYPHHAAGFAPLGQPFPLGPGSFGFVVGGGSTNDQFLRYDQVFIVHVGRPVCSGPVPPVGPRRSGHSGCPMGFQGPAAPTGPRCSGLVDPRLLAKRAAPSTALSGSATAVGGYFLPGCCSSLLLGAECSCLTLSFVPVGRWGKRSRR